MAVAATVVAANAANGGNVFVRSPIATPVNATCDMLSAIKDRRRNTRNVPRAGAKSPTSVAPMKARIMKSYSNIDGMSLTVLV